jgi:RNA polymerase sigma-70 factor, ECF subfamily
MEVCPMSDARPLIARVGAGRTVFGARASDMTLVKHAQSGENRAFDQLVLKYRPRVVRIAARYTRNPADAEDAAQEAFIKAYCGLRYFRGESRFYTWLYRIAINCASHLLKARGRDLISGAVNLPSGSDSGPYLGHPREWDTPEQLRITEDIGAMVNATLDALCERQRTAIILREFNGLSYKAIATEMAIPIGTARSYVSRGRDFIDHRLRRVCAGLGRGNRFDRHYGTPKPDRRPRGDCY